jgi:hypothetical protein
VAKTKNFIFYRGPSMLDGAPIVAVATIEPSDNSKTGNMVQTWILRADTNPIAASKEGKDSSVCGNCTHRGKYNYVDNIATLIPQTRSCYVTLMHAPRSVWAAFNRGSYADLSCDLPTAAERVAGRKVRMGSYGDPAAVPYPVWEAFLALVAGITGYSHQWQRFPEFARWVMASCDSSEERVMARALGFRTFRVAPAHGWEKEAHESLCPASEEAGKKTTCILCQACGGHSSKARADIFIPAHGQGKAYVAVGGA